MGWAGRGAVPPPPPDAFAQSYLIYRQSILHCVAYEINFKNLILVCCLEDNNASNAIPVEK